MEKPRNLTTRQYVGLVRDLNARMAQMPPLFHKSQQLDKSELVDSLSNKAPRTHKAILISQGFNPEIANIETFVEHCKRAETTDNITGVKFAAPDEDSELRKKKCTKSTTIMVRNARSVTPRFIALSMERIPVTPHGSLRFSSLKARKIQNSLKRTSRKIPGRSIY